MPNLYSITYPAKLPEEGIIPGDERGLGVTNHLALKELVDSIIESKHQGWETKDLGTMTEQEAIEKQAEDGGSIEIPLGEEWKVDRKGLWATAGLMARLAGAKMYEIGYSRDGVGYTNKYSIAEEADVFSEADEALWYWEPLFVQNEAELKGYKYSDGGCEGFFESNRNKGSGAKGWITKDYESFLQYTKDYHGSHAKG